MSLIRVITRISPLNPVQEPLLSLGDFGHPRGFRTSSVTDPSTSSRYTVETALFSETSPDQEFLERFPGLVSASELDPVMGDRIETFLVPRRILREEMQHLMEPEPAEQCGLRIRFNLRQIERMRRDSKQRHSEKRKRAQMLRPLLRYFVDGECLICGFLLSDTIKGNIVHHLDTHIGSASYKCNSCKVVSSSVKEFYAHSLTHQKTRPYLCATCGKSFKRKHFLTVHDLRVHSAEPPVQSPFNESFLRQYIPPSFACSLCGKHLSSYEEVSSHTETHSKKESYQCLFCGKSYLFALVQYHSHMRGIPRRHACNHCNRKFIFRNQFLQHRKDHLSEKGYKCEKCMKKFYYHKNLLNHVEMVHPKPIGEQKPALADLPGLIVE